MLSRRFSWSEMPIKKCRYSAARAPARIFSSPGLRFVCFVYWGLRARRFTWPSFEMRTVSDTLKKAHTAFNASQGTQKMQYDRMCHAKMMHLSPGDEVRLKNANFRPGVSRKMHEPWSPIFGVVGMVGRRHVDYLDPRTGSTRRTHLKLVKPVVRREV